MKLKALSNYDGDKSTRFGDCILIYDLTSMIVYDCGHGKHAEYVESIFIFHHFNYFDFEGKQVQTLLLFAGLVIRICPNKHCCPTLYNGHCPKHRVYPSSRPGSPAVFHTPAE